MSALSSTLVANAPTALDPDLELQPRLLAMAERAIEHLRLRGNRAAVCRLRGRGPGTSFKSEVEAWERRYPVELAYPFEENERVGGAVWPNPPGAVPCCNAVMKLRWESRANDLPMHSHEHSDRCIIVLEGRGFFHVTDEPANAFTGRHVRTVAARERDVFVFSRGVTHTFSTFDHPMVLLSCHLPFIALDDPKQYMLPAVRWTAAEQLPVCPDHTIDLDGWASLANVV